MSIFLAYARLTNTLLTKVPSQVLTYVFFNRNNLAIT